MTTRALQSERRTSRPRVYPLPGARFADNMMGSPAYDLNPTPTDVRQRILTTNISLDEATCDLELAKSVAEYVGLASTRANVIIRQVAMATARWRRKPLTRGIPVCRTRHRGPAVAASR